MGSPRESSLFEKLGVDDPWSGGSSFLRGFDLVYLTLPPDEDELEEGEDETARDLMARMARRSRAARQRRQASSRRRMMDRLQALDRDRPGVRDRMARSRGLDRTSRPSHASLWESSFVFTEAEEPEVEELEEEESTSRWGRSERRSRARTRTQPKTSTLDATRPARAVRSPVPSTRPMQRALRVARTTQPVAAPRSGDGRAHEAVALLQEARRLRDDAAATLRRAASEVQRAPAHARERVVRRALRSLPPVARRSVTATVRSAPRTGASPMASVSARFEGIGRGQRSLRPTIWSSPSIVPLQFEEEPEITATAEPSVPQAPARRERRVSRAARDVRSQARASRAGPAAPSEAPIAPSVPVAPPTERLARRGLSATVAASNPSQARGVRAAMAPARSADAVRHQERIVRRTRARLETDSIVPRIASSTAEARTAGPRVERKITRARTSASERPSRTTGSVRALRRGQPFRRHSVFSMPTQYVVLEPTPELAADEAEEQGLDTRSAPGVQRAARTTTRAAAPRSAAQARALDQAPAPASRRVDAAVARGAEAPALRASSSSTRPTARLTQRLDVAAPAGLQDDPRPAAPRGPVRLDVSRPLDRVAIREDFGTDQVSAPSIRAVARTQVAARSQRGQLRLAPSRSSHVVRRSSMWSPTATVLESFDAVPAETTDEDVATGLREGARRHTARSVSRRETPPAARAALRSVPARRPTAHVSDRTAAPAARRQTASVRAAALRTAAATERPTRTRSSAAVARAERRGSSLRRLSAGGVLWPSHAPMVHVEPTTEGSTDSSDEALTQAPVRSAGDRAVRRTDTSRAAASGRATSRRATSERRHDAPTDRSPATVSGTPDAPAAERIIARAPQLSDEAVATSRLERIAARADEAPATEAPRETRALSRAEVSPSTRALRWTPSQTLLEPTVAEPDDLGLDEVDDRPTLRAARRGEDAPVRDSSGRATGRARAVVAPVATEQATRAQRVARRASTRGDVPATSTRVRPAAGSRATSTASRPSTAATAPATARAMRRGQRRLSPTRRRVWSAPPSVVLTAEDVESTSVADESPALRRMPTTARVAARSASPVRMDGRGVGQLVRRPTAYVDIGEEEASTAEARLSRGAQPTARRSAISWVGGLDVLLEAGLPVSEPAEDAATTVQRVADRADAGRPADVRRARERVRRPAFRATPEQTMLAPQDVLVEASERVIGTASAMRDPGAARRVVTRVRSVPSGSTGWAATRLAAVQADSRPTSTSDTSRLAAALRRGGRVAVNPARFARMAGDLSWLEVAFPDEAVDAEAREALSDRLGDRGESGAVRGQTRPARGATVAPLGTVVDTADQDDTRADEPGRADARSASPSSRALARMTERRAQVGTRRRPFSGVAAVEAPGSSRRSARRGRPGRRRRPGVAVDALALPQAYDASVDVEDDDQPTWARRDGERPLAGGRDRMIGERPGFRADHPIVNALARSASAEEMASIVSTSGMSTQQLRRALPGPAVKLVERIVTLERTARIERREEARHVMGLRMRGTGPEPDFVRPNAQAKQNGAQRQFLPVAPAMTAPSLGATKVTNLANKLLNLIHLAENEQRVEDAQAQVRMSDSEVSASAPGTEKAGGQAPNIKALQREVFEYALSELNLLAILDPEDPDGRSKWW